MSETAALLRVVPYVLVCIAFRMPFFSPQAPAAPPAMPVEPIAGILDASTRCAAAHQCDDRRTVWNHSVCR